MPTTESFLAHHGVKGMRWGIRKERKAVKQDFRARYKANITKELAKAERRTAGLRKQADTLARTHHFDLDDGGGGITKKDKEAGKKYMQLHEKIQAEEDAAFEAARSLTVNHMLQTHGVKKLTDLRLKRYTH